MLVWFCPVLLSATLAFAVDSEELNFPYLRCMPAPKRVRLGGGERKFQTNLVKVETNMSKFVKKDPSRNSAS